LVGEKEKREERNRCVEREREALMILNPITRFGALNEFRENDYS
jgi:hypothetical protein